MEQPRNLTIRLDKPIIDKARVLAARRGTSISRLVASTIEQLVREDEGYEQAMRAAFEELDAGLELGGPPYLSRDELHVR